MKNKILIALEFLWYATFINILAIIFVEFTSGSVHSVWILLFNIPLMALSIYYAHYYFSAALKDFKKAIKFL